MTDPVNPLLDEALRLKSEMQQVKAAPTVTDLAVEARKLRAERDAAALRQTAVGAQDSTPDTAARALALGKQTGLPPAVVERNLPEVERKAEMDRLSRVAEDPALAAFVTEPTNYRIARDDLDTLQTLSDLARSLPAGFAKAAGSVLSGAGTLYDTTARTLFGRPIDTALDAMGLGSLSDYSPDVPRWALPSEILRGPGEALKGLGADIGVPKERQNIGTDIVEGVGQLAQQILLAIATGGATSAVALFSQGVDQQRERQDKVGAYGTVEGDAAIVAGGAVTALTEKYGLDFILRRVPDAVRAGIMRKLTDVALTAGNEAAQEVVEGVLQNVIEYSFYNPDAEILQDFSREAIAAGGAAAVVRSLVLAATGAGRRRAEGQKAAEQAQKDAEALAQIDQLAQQSKLRERSPEKFSEFVRGLVDGDRSVEIDAETAVVLFQSEPDLTRFLPADEAERLMRDVAVARETGADVRMPLSAFVGAFAGHERFADLAENVRLQDEGLTAREAREWSDEEIEREMSLIRDDVANVAGQVDAARAIFDDMLAQLKAAAVDDVAATKYAAIVSARVRTRAERLGVDPMDLWFDQRPLIRRDITGARKFDSRQLVIDDLRSGFRPSTRAAYGDSMLETIAAMGGMIDKGGELKAMDADKWHRGKPGRKRLIRDAGPSGPDMLGGSGFTSEYHADRIARSMQEAGFIPANVPEDELVPTLFEMISRELAGDPVYSERQRNDRLVTRLEAMDQLTAFLDYAGLNIQTATDEQIREALDRYAAEQATADAGDGRTMEQSVSLRSGTETLKRFGVEPGKKYKTRDVAAALEARQRQKYGTIEADDRSVDAERRIASWMVEEILLEVEEAKKNPKKSPVGWYSIKFQRGLDSMGAAFPELVDDKARAADDAPAGVKMLPSRKAARTLLTAIIAVTSDGAKVADNLRFAARIYEGFRQTGKIDNPFAFGGTRNASMMRNVEMIARLVEARGIDGLEDFLLQQDSVGNLKRMAEEAGVAFSTGYTVDTMMPVSTAMFGPKLGAFFANLMGSTGYLTMDRWWSRTFNRYRGTLLQAPTESGLQRFKELVTKDRRLNAPAEMMTDDEALALTVDYVKSYKAKGYKDGSEIEKAANTLYKAAFENLEDQPFNAGDRTFMIATTMRAQKMLARRGVDLTIADIQAVLWYYEKRLYGQMGARQTADVSYEDVARKAADEIVLGRQVPAGGQQRPDGADAGGELGAAASLDVAAEREIPEVADDDVDDEFDDDAGTDRVLNQPAWHGSPYLFDDSRVQVTEFEQDGSGQTPRGSIRFLPSGQSIITLTEKADLSTFLHELSHGWLEEMKADAQREDAPADIRADWQRIAAYLKIDPEVDVIPTEAHETFARTGEAYFMEGKAPSLDLASAFERFKSWLVRIYQTIRGLNVPVNDEIRGVFDRMLATDAEIAQVREQFKFDGMFATAKDAGMTDAEFERYAALAAQARLEAEQRVAKRLQREAERVNGTEYAEAREAVANEVEAQVKAEPVYQAIHYLQTGEMLDGTQPKRAGLKLNRKALKEEYGAGIVKQLPRGVTEKGGVPPELVGVLFGFTSGDELVQAMVNAQPMQAEIQRRIDERMRERFPDPTKDGRAHEAAIEAMHGDGQMRVLEAEFRALKKLGAGQVVEAAVRRKMAGRAAPTQGDVQAAEVDQGESEALRMGPGADARSRAEAVTGRLAVDATKRTARAARADQAAARRIAVDSLRVDEKALEAAAERLVAASKVSDLLNANRWRRAEKQAADDVAQAIAARQYGEAAWHQRRRIVNAYMVRRSAAVRAEVEKAIERFDKYQSKRPPTSIDPDYLDKARTVLAAYQFGPKLSDRRRTILALQAINKWQQQLDENEQAQLEIPAEILAADEKTHYRDMAVGDFMALRDTVENIVTVGRTKNRLLRAAKERDLNRAAALVGETIRQNLKEKPGREQIERGLFDKAGEFVSGFFASHRKIENLTREFDGFADQGPAWSTLFKPLQDAQNEETRLSIEAASKLKALFAGYPEDARKTWRTRKVWFPELGQSFTKSTIMSLALNWGNEGNREAIRKAFKWNDDQVNAAFSRVMTRADWEFVQAAWDMIDGYWPALAALEKRVKGKEPEKVEAAPVETPFGTFRGGYYPLKYDAGRSERAYAHNVDKMAQQLMSGFVAKASTRAGAANERVGSGGMPVRLELDVMFEHIGEVIHDITHREAVLDVNRLIDHPEIKGAVLDTKGPQFHRAMKDHVRDIAAGDVPALNWLDQTINHLRTGVSISAMGWKLTTALVQVTGFAQSIPRVGVGPLAKSVAKFYGNPLAMAEKVRFVFDRSVEMRTRSNNWDRDVRDQLRRLGPTAGRTADVKRSFFYLTSMMDMGVAVPTWIAAYEKGMARSGDEVQAIQYADMVVRQTQSSGLAKDLAAIQRGGPTAKMFTAFYSYFSATYNLMIDEFKQLKQPRDFPRFAANMAFLTFVPAVLSELLMGRGPDEEDREDEIGWLRWAGATTLKYALSGFVGVRDVVSALGSNFGYAGSPVGGAVEAAVNLGKQIGEGDADRALAKAAFDTAGPLLHLPSRQAWITAEGLYLWAEGYDISPFEMFVTRDSQKFR